MKKRTKKSIIIVSAIAFSILLILGAVMLLTPRISKTYSFYDKNYGLITYKVQTASILNPVQQSYFDKTSIVLGNSVTINTFVNKIITSSVYYNQMSYAYINIVGAQSLSIPVMNKIIPNSDQTFSISFTPQQLGQYTANLVIGFKDGTTQTFSKDNTLTVTTAANACTKLPKYDSWSLLTNINGGIIQQRNFYLVDTSCNWVVKNQEEQISCNSGYVVQGTSSTAQPYSGQICIALSPTDPPVTGNCNADITDACSDGTTVVLQACVQGTLLSTGYKCTVVNPPIQDTSGYNYGSAGCFNVAFGAQYKTLTECQAVHLVQNSSNNNGAPNNESLADYTKYYVWGAIALFATLILTIIILSIRRR